MDDGLIRDFTFPKLENKQEQELQMLYLTGLKRE